MTDFLKIQRMINQVKGSTGQPFQLVLNEDGSWEISNRAYILAHAEGVTIVDGLFGDTIENLESLLERY